MNRNEIERGIAAYKHEQTVLLRLMRRYKSFTEKDFDRWLRGREFRRSTKLSGRGICGDSFILGMGVNGGNMWALWLDLMQHMIALGMVDATKEGGVIVYRSMQ